MSACCKRSRVTANSPPHPPDGNPNSCSFLAHHQLLVHRPNLSPTKLSPTLRPYLHCARETNRADATPDWSSPARTTRCIVSSRPHKTTHLQSFSCPLAETVLESVQCKCLGCIILALLSAPDEATLLSAETVVVVAA